MFLFLSGTAVPVVIVLYSWQIATDFFMIASGSNARNLTERLPEGSLTSLWYKMLLAQSFLLVATSVWAKRRKPLPPQQPVNDRMRYGVGLGLLMTTVAYLYDPFATRLPREIMERGMPVNALALARPDGSRISISARLPSSEYSSSEHLLSELPLTHPSQKKDDKEVDSNARASLPPLQATQGPPDIQPQGARNEVHARVPDSIYPTGISTAPMTTQIWVLWRADNVDCMKLLEQIVRHRKRFPDAWRHTRLMVINEGDDMLTLTRSLFPLQSLAGEVVWDKQQQLLATLKLQVLPITLLLDARALLKGGLRVQDYKIGYTRF